MKKLVALIIAVAISSFCFAQNMESYFKYEGVRTLAFMAHPTNTFKTGQYNVYNNKVWVKIYYENNYVTELEVYRSGDVFTGIRIIRDNDWAYPFTGIALIKDLVIELAKEAEDQRALSIMEKALNKTLEYMDGEDLAITALTIGWYGY